MQNMWEKINSVLKAGRYWSIYSRNIRNIRRLYSILDDDESRNTLINILRARCIPFHEQSYYFNKFFYNNNMKYQHTSKKGYKIFGPENPYFLTDFFHINKSMILLDGGAYNGDTIMQLHKLLDGKCNHIYAFEPNPITYNQLINNTKEFDNISYYKYALDNHFGKESFIFDGAASRVNEHGNETIECINSSAFLRSLTEKYPTFIKLDIEGKEVDVIQSISWYINEYSPDLAISIYHRKSDLWEIPLLLKKINPKYKLILRHQSNFSTETICYATSAVK